MNSYSEQRKERLSDVIFEYLSDEKTTPDELLCDLIEEVKDSYDYYNKHAIKCRKVLDMLPNNNILETTNAKDWEEFWSSYTSEEN